MNLLVDKELREKIILDVKAAWPDVVDRVQTGDPRLVPSRSPFAVVRLDEVSSEWESLRAVEQTYRFEVSCVENLPQGVNIEDRKSDRANALIDMLTESTVYAEIGRLPFISGVQFEEPDDPREQMTTIIIFEVKVSQFALKADRETGG